MADIPLSVFHRDDYAAFRELIPALPETYDEWCSEHTKLAEQWLLRNEDVRRIEVHPDEYKRFCKRTGLPHHTQSLHHFTVERAAGRRF